VNSKLHELFDQLERQRLSLLNEIREIAEGQINHSRNKKWSVSQIAGHLITAERLSLSYMTKKINAIQEVGNTGMLGELKLLLFIASQRLPLKYKAPKNLSEQPKSYPDFKSLELDWNESRQQLEEFLEKFPSEGLKRKIYRHPVMGRCNIVHALVFFREHIIHHYPQIKRQLSN
jgi:uncharacterized damage-inducible protein DinB